MLGEPDAPAPQSKLDIQNYVKWYLLTPGIFVAILSAVAGFFASHYFRSAVSFQAASQAYEHARKEIERINKSSNDASASLGELRANVKRVGTDLDNTFTDLERIKRTLNTAENILAANGLAREISATLARDQGFIQAVSPRLLSAVSPLLNITYNHTPSPPAEHHYRVHADKAYEVEIDKLAGDPNKRIILAWYTLTNPDPQYMPFTNVDCRVRDNRVFLYANPRDRSGSATLDIRLYVLYEITTIRSM